MRLELLRHPHRLTGRRPADSGRVLQSSDTPTVAVNTTLLHTAYPLEWPTNYNGSQPYVSAETPDQTTAICLELNLGVRVCVSVL